MCVCVCVYYIIYIYILYIYILYALSVARSGLDKTQSDWGAFFEQLKAFKAWCAHAHVPEPYGSI